MNIASVEKLRPDPMSELYAVQPPERVPPPFVEYPYPLPGREINCVLVLPRDLRADEARRLSGFIATLVDPDLPALQFGKGGA